MQLISLTFLLFCSATVLLLYVMPPRHRWMFLLAASYIFYAVWGIEYLPVLVAASLLTYISGILIYRAKQDKRKKLLLVASIAGLLGILVFFKYLNFLHESVSTILESANIDFGKGTYSILAPIGISFYMLKSIGYLIDVYRGRESENNFFVLSFFISFFPQIVAGPIDRSQSFIPQIREEKGFEAKLFHEGIILILWGCFKKLVIADRLGLFVDAVFNGPMDHQRIFYITAMYFFTLQIYFDFSAYSDMAIGLSRIAGYKSMDNFNNPYLAASVRDFWRRWHISLSTWFRDYVFIPLGGSRVGEARQYMNLVIVFIISGLWHGANWTFILWGGIHAFYMCVSRLTSEIRSRYFNCLFCKNAKVLGVLKVFITFNLVAFAWICFRSNSVDGFFRFCGSMITGRHEGTSSIQAFNTQDYYIIGLYSLFALLMEFKQPFNRIYISITKQPVVLRWVFYYFCIFSIILFGVTESSQFIYSQF